ncbi:harbinger transposase derived 1-like isoform X1 [Xenopus tropicalis]|uniref:Harbinger transposase derived 1-like n=2 Tax=Xenopus tropicalis TaxID=8364 RepID=A0A803JX95_XENTR|nr:harbinger transposase derived 1-like isoform X1 [Xenopus tropicalis]XP_031759140.1 harbinger transposase derived 1-like isoform X1 [Xenopus tropicalis]
MESHFSSSPEMEPRRLEGKWENEEPDAEDQVQPKFEIDSFYDPALHGPVSSLLAASPAPQPEILQIKIKEEESDSEDHLHPNERSSATLTDGDDVVVKKRRQWVQPMCYQRFSKGQFHLLYGKLRKNPEKFFAYIRMSISTFDELLKLVHPHLHRMDTNMRQAISPAERLVVTLRFLATGSTFAALHYQFLIGRATIGMIVRETCKTIWNVTKDLVMPEPNTEKWMKIAEGFYEKTDFPNCIGALDGKHIRVTRPPNTVSKSCSKVFFTVLLALVDSSYCFTYIDVGAYGSDGDASGFFKSNLGKMVNEGKLNFPANKPLPGTKGPALPYVIVADEAFGISTNVMRPYPIRNLTGTKRAFNYRLTRARRMVECAFGILANKWRVFHSAIQLNTAFVDDIIKCACVLHNLVLLRDGIVFEDSILDPLPGVPWNVVRGPNSGMSVRDAYAQYFASTQGEVPWQNENF